MALSIVPFEERHVDAAAELLAQRHRRDRQREPDLPAAYESPEQTRPAVQRALEPTGTRGVAALRDGALVGYMIAAPQLFPPTHFLSQFFPPRGAACGYAAHAVADGEDAVSLYREMYAGLSASLVRSGYFVHQVELPAKDAEAQEAFVSLAFGRDLCLALSGVEPASGRTSANVGVHTASSEDIEVILKLNHELALHHVNAPIFAPLVPETEPSHREFQSGLLNNPDDPHFVAYDGGRALGMQTFMPPLFLSPLSAPEGAVYLFQGIVTKDARAGGIGTAILDHAMAWAREQGYRHCALHYATPNIEGARFWTRSGFRPLTYRMTRWIDERIAWANV